MASDAYLPTATGSCHRAPGWHFGRREQARPSGIEHHRAGGVIDPPLAPIQWPTRSQETSMMPPALITPSSAAASLQCERFWNDRSNETHPATSWQELDS